MNRITVYNDVSGTPALEDTGYSFVFPVCSGHVMGNWQIIKLEENWGKSLKRSTLLNLSLFQEWA